MSVTLSQSRKAVLPGGFVSFLASGGIAPYTFSVKPDGVGGTIDPSNGVYIGPQAIVNQRVTSDTILVVDDVGDEAEAIVSIGGPLTLLCDIIQTEMSLPNGRVYLWNQKLMQPTDSDLYIAVSVLHDEPIANVNRQVSVGPDLVSEQYVLVRSIVGIDMISRGPIAREARLDLLLAINSNYSQQQQNSNGFSIGRLPANKTMVALNQVEGSAIPYRFHTDISMQYAYSKNSAVDFFDNFPGFEVTVNS